ncbi:MAG: ROK family protein [Clostridia bacterium]|nr:ROK family protein [Clostridia bacterium]
MKFVPVYDPDFRPCALVLKEYQAMVESNPSHPLCFAVERNDGYVYRVDTAYPDTVTEESYRVIERLVKTVLWAVGGFRVYVYGDAGVAQQLAEDYAEGGVRAFDANFMARVYGEPFAVVCCENEEDVPANNECSVSAGGHLDGNRIGFDAGGSDRKVSAVKNGEVVFSEEVVWFPKTNTDPEYHYQGILDSMRRAASYLPSVDAIGVSSAGIYVDNKIKVASLFIKVSDEDFKAKVEDMYERVAKEVAGDAPLVVANDGDVTALAGAMDLNDNCVLGIAMGTSEAAGYIDGNGNLRGWLSELAFAPVDFNEGAMEDEWSGDIGCGVKYFSQDGVIKLAAKAGIALDENASPAEKLKAVQKLSEEGDERALQIYKDIGVYLGYTLPYYARFYDIKHVLVLGRVTSGVGGSLIVEYANKVLGEEFSELSLQLHLPDESNRRVGQSIAAASLPALKA